MKTIKYRPVINLRQRAIINLHRRRMGLQPIKIEDGAIKNSNESYAYTYIKATIAKLLNLITPKSHLTHKARDIKQKKHIWLEEMEKQRNSRNKDD